jgi:hypothetical protein
MKLPEVDFKSNQWLEVERWLKESLEDVKTALLDSGKDPIETANLRGKAALIRTMLRFSSQN